MPRFFPLAALLRGEWKLERRILDNAKTSEALSKACAGHAPLPDVKLCGPALLGHVDDGKAVFTTVPLAAVATRFTDAQVAKVRGQLGDEAKSQPFAGGMGVGTEGGAGADVLLYEEKGTFHLKGAGEMGMRREYLYLVGNVDDEGWMQQAAGQEAQPFAPDVCVFFHIPNNEAEHLKFFHRLRFGTRAPEGAGAASVVGAAQSATSGQAVAHAEHLCVQDLYKVAFSIATEGLEGRASEVKASGAAASGAVSSSASASASASAATQTNPSFDSFATSWNVTGPSKDYTIHSLYTRV